MDGDLVLEVMVADSEEDLVLETLLFDDESGVAVTVGAVSMHEQRVLMVWGSWVKQLDQTEALDRLAVGAGLALVIVVCLSFPRFSTPLAVTVTAGMG